MRNHNKILLCLIGMLFIINSMVYGIGIEDYSLGRIVFKLIVYIIIIIFVLVMSIYVTKFVARTSKRFINSKYIEVVDNLNIGPNLKLLIIKVKENIYILTIANNNVEVIDKVTTSEFKFKRDYNGHLQKGNENYTGAGYYFKDIQAKVKQKFSKSYKDIKEEEEYNGKNN